MGLDKNVIIPVSVFVIPLLFNEDTSLHFVILLVRSLELRKKPTHINLFCEVSRNTPSKKARNAGPKTKNTNSIVGLYAIVYGSSRTSKSVGDFLQQLAIHLQDPP